MGAIEELQEAIKELRRASDKLASVFQLSPLPQPTIMEPQSHSPRKEEGPRSEVHGTGATQLEAVANGKQTRSGIFMSSAEVFARWDQGLCELCDKPYFPGHKCKKRGPNTLFVIVAEEGDPMQLDVGVKNHPVMDASQVVEESPKGDIHIRLDDGFGEGQGKGPGGFEVVPCEQFGGLNPSNGLLQKSTPSIHDKLASNAQQEQHLLKEMNQQPKKLVHLPFIWDWQWVLGPRSECTEAGWCSLFAKNLGGEAANCFCLIAFDPGGILFRPKWLLSDFHTIHNLEARGVFFYPGKLMSLVLMYGWLVAFTLAVVRLVFDPGGKIVSSGHSTEEAGKEGLQGWGLPPCAMVQQTYGTSYLGAVYYTDIDAGFPSFNFGSLRTSFLKGEAFDRGKMQLLMNHVRRTGSFNEAVRGLLEGGSGLLESFKAGGRFLFSASFLRAVARALHGMDE